MKAAPHLNMEFLNREKITSRHAKSAKGGKVFFAFLVGFVVQKIQAMSQHD